MDNSSPPADHGIQQQQTYLEPRRIMSRPAPGNTDEGIGSRHRLVDDGPRHDLFSSYIGKQGGRPVFSLHLTTTIDRPPPPPCHIDPMDNSSQKQTYLEPTVIMMRLSPAQAERMDRRTRRNNDDPRLDRFGRRLRRMTDYSYPYMPPSRALDFDFGEPTVVIPKLQGAHADDYIVHLVYPPFTPSVCHDPEQQLPLEDGATKVVCLANMLPSSQHGLLGDEEFYDHFVDDVEVQACEFGKLVKLVIPRPNVDPPAGAVGKVFLKFACLDGANACKIMMDRNCWKGDDEQIVARFYPEDKFAAGDYMALDNELMYLEERNPTRRSLALSANYQRRVASVPGKKY